MQIREAGDWTVYGYGTPSGGDEVAILANECRGAHVLATWGADYGSGFQAIAQVNEETYQQLLKCTHVDDMRKIIEPLTLLKA